MSTHSISAACKVCKKPLVLKVDDDFCWPLERWLKMAACNRCFDIHERLIKAQANIQNACLWLTQNHSTPPEKLTATQKKLEGWTKDYAEAVAAQNNASVVVWSTEMAEFLMQQPHNWYEQLKFYRKNVQQHAQFAGINA